MARSRLPATSVAACCIALGLTACDEMGIGTCVYTHIQIPEAAINLAPLNSPYDDWNCGPPDEMLALGDSLLFSSTRNSAGQDFDLIPHSLWLTSADASRFSMVDESMVGDRLYDRMAVLANTVNNAQDQLGPTFLNSGTLTYAEGTGAQHNLKALVLDPTYTPGANETVSAELVVSDYVYTTDPITGEVTGSGWSHTLNPAAMTITLTQLNSAGDDGYLSYDSVTNKLYFHSDRSGAYRIYEVTVTSGVDPLAWLQAPDSNITIREMTELASDGNDRTPYVADGKMFFVSDRSGGLGGFDIYYTTWDGAAWSAPFNLGANVNSAANEYRPAYIGQFEQGAAIIYSSDRAGGAGGYDLYLVRVAF